MAAAPSIDTLFQVPLADFTATRNALAKGAGADGAAIRAIEKPSSAAWAVNQVYWRERRLYDKLVRAAERVRAGHGARLKGKRVDLAPVELAHRAALRDAEAAARAALIGAGDAATAATMKGVQDTLQALPVEGPPGRLTRPPAPVGFGALSGLLERAAGRTGQADIVRFAVSGPATRPSAREEAQARKAAEREAARLEAEAARARARRQELEATERGLAGRRDQARARVTDLTAALDHAKTDVAAAERDLAAVRAKLATLPD
jgi:hypothetical protein